MALSASQPRRLPFPGRALFGVRSVCLCKVGGGRREGQEERPGEPTYTHMRGGDLLTSDFFLSPCIQRQYVISRSFLL